MKRRTAYRPHIDGLRTIAVLTVMFYHMNIPTFQGGYVGVDVFFVISGFLITNLIKVEIELSGKFDFFRFYLRRARRLLPALLSVAIATAVFAAVAFSSSQLARFGGSLYSALLSVSNFYFWLEADYFDVASDLKPLLHTWSLSVEEQFYFIWPALMLILYKIGAPRLIPAMLFVAATFSIAMNFIFGDGHVEFISYFMPGLESLFEDGKSTIFFLLPFRIFEFAIGAALVWVPHGLRKWYFLDDVAVVVGLVLILGSVTLFHEKMLFPSYYAFAPCLGAALIIYGGHGAHLAWLLKNRAMVGIGLISYSLYLVHWPIIVFWTYIYGPITGYQIILATALCFVLAILNYRFIEQKFRQPKNPYLNRRFVIQGLAIIASCIVLGVSMKDSSGWTWRLPNSTFISLVSAASASDAGEGGKQFHRQYYGGTGYRRYGPLDPENPPEVIIVGDSHGAHYAHGVHEVLLSSHEDMYLAAGTSCFHLPGFSRTTVGVDWDRRCVAALDQALLAINLSEKPLVILSHSWVSQMKVAAKLSPDGRRLAGEVTVDDIIEGIMDFKRLIGDATLVVIGNVPGTGGVDLFDRFTRPRWITGSTDKFRQSPARPAALDLNARLRQASNESGEFLFFDPFDVLCEQGECANFDENGYPIYSDNAHLSKFGSSKLVRELQARIVTRAEARAVRPSSAPRPGQPIAARGF